MNTETQLLDWGVGRRAELESTLSFFGEHPRRSQERRTRQQPSGRQYEKIKLAVARNPAVGWTRLAHWVQLDLNRNAVLPVISETVHFW